MDERRIGRDRVSAGAELAVRSATQQTAPLHDRVTRAFNALTSLGMDLFDLMQQHQERQLKGQRQRSQQQHFLDDS